MYVCIICRLSSTNISVITFLLCVCVLEHVLIQRRTLGDPLCHSPYYSFEIDLSLSLELDWWPQSPRESPASSISAVLGLQA